MCTDKKIETADELEFAVFCIENVAARLHVHAEAVYKAFTGQSDILHGYITVSYTHLTLPTSDLV